MSAFLAGIGKTLNIWPDTDYLSLIPKKSPTQEAWENVGRSLAHAMRKQDDLIKELETKQPDYFSIEQKSHLNKARQLLDSYEVESDNAYRKAQLIQIEITRLNQELAELQSKLNQLSSKD